MEGKRYVEPVHSEVKGNYIDHIYNITSARDDYINPKTDGKLSWWSVISCTSYLGEEL